MVLKALRAYVFLILGGDAGGEDAAEFGFVLDIEEAVIIENPTEGSGIRYGAPNPEFFQ